MRTALAAPVALQTGDVTGARCRDAECLQLSPFTAKIRNEQLLTVTGLVCYANAVAG